MSKPHLHGIDGSDPLQQQAAAWFARLHADNVTEREREQWQDWLARDPRHRQAYAQFEALWSSLGDFAPTTEIAQRTRAAGANAPRFGSTPLRWMAAAVAFAGLLGGALLWRTPAEPELLYATAIGEQRSLQLEDGTRVDLDTNSQLRVQYNHRERKISLDRGRAFFRVAHQQRPLRVVTGANSVRAVGTQFEVYRQTGMVDVALFEGRVELLAAVAGEKPGLTLATLDPGQKARINGQQISFSTEPVMAGGVPDWTSRRLVFDDTPLDEALAELNRYSHHPITLQTPALGRHRISGVFRNDTAEGFIEALHEVYGIDSSRTAEGGYVLKEQH